MHLKTKNVLSTKNRLTKNNVIYYKLYFYILDKI